jgi:hypothetical protein
MRYAIQRLELFFTYFGGKWRIAKHYPQPQHKTLIEPFAGSAGYSLHYPQKNVLLFDRDPVICSVWDYLIRVKESEILALPLAITDVREMSLCQEAKWLIGFWLNKGMTSPCNIPSKWMRDHATDGSRLNTYWGAGVRQRIASQLSQIRHWKVENKSYDQIENKKASWFVDPPYQVSGVRYRYNKVDFDHLAHWCQSREGQVMACEQDGATWLPFSPFRTVKALEGKKGAKQSKEVLWLNS